jgi:hypothetical protein
MRATLKTRHLVLLVAVAVPLATMAEEPKTLKEHTG